MSTVAHVLQSKGCAVQTISPDATVLDAARRMNEHRIGSLVVVDDSGKPVGIFTERDILTRIVAAEKPPSATRVREVMSDRLLTCSPETDVDQLRHTMRTRRLRHIPVIDSGRLAGMVSLGDLNTAEVKVLCQTIEYLEQYSVRT
ncbi:MAG: CBS domain-containing protein [Phycisphaerales bacterium]|nr:CBS domain-containing protein [Phycisphaerales bacterium]